MYFRLNKKILYSMLCLLIVLIVIFFIIFINLYSQKLQDNQNTMYIRNQYVVSLLYDKVRMQKQLSEIAAKYPKAITDQSLLPSNNGLDIAQRELSNEQKLNQELRENYNNNKEAIITGAKIVGISLLFVIFFVLLMLLLLDYWVVMPVEKLIKISKEVSVGVFSSRLKIPEVRYFRDEFDTLYATFNKMLDSMEQNIEEAKLRGKFLQQLLDAIPEGIRVIDRNYNVIMANNSFNELFKIKEVDGENKCYSAYGYDGCDGCPVSRYNCPIKHFNNGAKEYLHTVHEVGKRPFYVNAAKLTFGKGINDYYIIEAIHDLSGDVRFSHEQKVSSLAFLSTSIAHEMKNNLGAIRIILESLLDSEYKDVPDENSSKKYLLMAYNQLVETVKTPERLLKLARYSDVENSMVDVYSSVKDMMMMIDYEAKNKGIMIKNNVGKDISFFGNEADFKMIILNLAQNAIKAMPNGGELEISGQYKGQNLILSVKDSGIGIEDEQIKHIFEPFYSANKYAKSSGLGLAIVSSLIEKINGKISVKSKVGKGTEFIIKIPAKSKKVKII